MKDISPADIAQWFREKARMFNQMASNVEDTFKAFPVPQTEQSQSILPDLGSITAEKVRAQVAVKGMRVATLAGMFKVPDYEVEKVIDSADSGLERGPRGWITLKKI